MPDQMPPRHSDAHQFALTRPVRVPTLMLVEDSRYASEVLRLYARALGLRLRRAPDLQSASAHLRLYRPDIVLVDLGLPDGRGEGLIAELASATPRPPLILATSGQSHLQADALAAGADVFIEKPMPDLAAFRALLVAHYPGALQLLLLPDHAQRPRPDPIALKDDLDFAAKSLSQVQADDDGADLRLTAARTRYVAGLLDGVAGSLGDAALQNAARAQLAGGPTAALAPQDPLQGPGSAQHSFRTLRDLVNDRLREVMGARAI
jgi:DNA-binding response OmpR family regulator